MLEKIPYDKKLHFIAGFLITFVVSIVLDSGAVGLVLGAIAGLGKEIKDQIVYHGFDYKDMLVTWAGSLIAFILYTLLFK